MFLEAYDLHSDAIYRHCYFRVYSKQRAEDLMQETFTKLWVYMSKGNKIDNIRALLYRIATNLIIDESRKKKERELDAMLEDDQIVEPSYAGHKEIESQAVISSIKERMQDLPEEERQLLTLRYFDDLDPKDIAEIMGITANNVSVKLNRAIKALKEFI
ncbi:MAG: RNA polymerase sigma factor [Patescibacteria group bacterium]